MTEPGISILMASYNKAEYIGAAIESVLGQNFSSWEMVIIDDCSTDDSIEVISKYSNDERIKIYQNKNNIGNTLTQIALINKANARIVGILDCDDVLASDALSKVMDIYEVDLDAGLVYTQSYRCDKLLKPLGFGDSGRIPPDESNLSHNLINHFKTFKKELYFKTAGYDRTMLAAEDIDMVFKLEEVVKIHYVDEPLYYYRVLPRSLSHGFKNEMTNRSSTALAKLNAYKRRLNTAIPNLDKDEIAEVLFFGIFTSLLARRFKLMFKLKKELWQINPLFLFQPNFYKLLVKKINKIIKIKLASKN